MALANVGRLPVGLLGGRTSPFTAADLATVLVWCAIAVALLTRRIRATVDEISLPAAVFVLVAAISTALGIQRYSVGFGEAMGIAAFLIRWVFYLGWYLFIVWCLTAQEARQVWGFFETAVLVFACFGILQSAFLPNFAQMFEGAPGSRAWDHQGHRLVSTMLDPNLAGILIAMVLLVRLARVAEGVEARGNGLMLTVLAAALLLTISRSSTLALAVGLACIVAMRGIRSRFSYVVGAGVALAIPALFFMRGYLNSLNRLTVDTSAVERFIPWARGAALFMEHPLLGVGFNAAAEAQKAHGWVLLGNSGVSMDGGLLFVAVMTGILGLVAYCWMLWRMLRVARRVYHNTTLAPSDRALGVGAIAATAALVAHSLFGNSLLLSFAMQVLWVLWATTMHVGSTPSSTGADLFASPVESKTAS